MALILAVNPGGGQSGTLARLARELQGHELIGADSCAVALTAVKRRVPDLILLPPQPALGQSELLTYLRGVPGGVRTLTLPPVTSVDPRAFATQVQQSLASPPGAASAHLLAAATALLNWVRERRASWAPSPSHDVVREPAPQRGLPVPVHVAAGSAPSWRIEKPGDYQPPRAWTPPPEPVEPEPPSFPSRVAGGASGIATEARESIARWIPRLAGLAAAGVLVVAGVNYWPKLQTAFTNGVLVLDSVPAGSQVFIDGNLAGTTPFRTDLPAGSHTVEFRDGDKSRMTKIVVLARSEVVESVDWTAKPTGNLLVKSDPSGARVFVDGKYRGTTPLTVDALAAGAHAVMLETGSGSVRRTVRIAVGQTFELSEALVPGWLAAFSPLEIEISEGNRQVRLDDSGRAILSPGLHKLRFQNRALGYDEVRTVEIKPTETTTLNLIPQTTLSITATQRSEVSIDGARVGGTPLVKRRINLGTHTVVVTSSSGDERQFVVEATSKPVQIDVDFSRPR
jgi:hypothetical protein